MIVPFLSKEEEKRIKYMGNDNFKDDYIAEKYVIIL
jgi:hypothetical protein